MRRKIIEVKCHFYHILTRVYAISMTCIDRNLDHLSYVGFVSILHVCFSTFPDCSLWKEVIMYSYTEGEGSYGPLL